ncbi:hypothetical protein BH23CHL2_BH23CHL2_05830 [soil metagenome]
MTETTDRTDQQKTFTVQSAADLRSIGLTPREIYRLRAMRDCLRCYPHLEFFANDQWRQLLFMKWRYDHGEYADDMPPKSVVIISDDFEK